LEEFLAIKKKRNKYGKKPDIHRENKYQGGAESWSSGSFKHAGETGLKRGGRRGGKP
jgi:hypothetical protein